MKSCYLNLAKQDHKNNEYDSERKSLKGMIELIVFIYIYYLIFQWFMRYEKKRYHREFLHSKISLLESERRIQNKLAISFNSCKNEGLRCPKFILSYFLVLYGSCVYSIFSNIKPMKIFRSDTGDILTIIIFLSKFLYSARDVIKRQCSLSQFRGFFRFHKL